jgi:hypothetical protein
MAFHFELRLAHGDDAGTFEKPPNAAGRSATPCSQRQPRYRITKIIPLELVKEFVDAALNGVLEVEPL